MKRVCAFFAVFVLLISAGCKKEENIQNKHTTPPSVYSANLDVNFKEIKMTARITKHSSQKHEIQMLTPEIMKPLNLIYDNGTCTVTYDGLTFETDLKRFPQAEFGGLLTQALSDIDSNIITQNINEDGTVTYKGITDYGDFIMIQDSETGLWKEFKIENIPLCVIFSDYKTN